MLPAAAPPPSEKTGEPASPPLPVPPPGIFSEPAGRARNARRLIRNAKGYTTASTDICDCPTDGVPPGRRSGPANKLGRRTKRAKGRLACDDPLAGGTQCSIQP